MRIVLLLAACLAWACPAQAVTRETLAGVSNFARVEMTIACAGTTTPAAVAGLKKMGYASVISLREAGEPGADIAAEAAAAKQAGIAFVHLPLNSASPDPAVADTFLKLIADKRRSPAFVHCASGNRAAALWMIKRLRVDRWDAERAGAEATALGLTSPGLKAFALDYAHRQGR